MGHFIASDGAMIAYLDDGRGPPLLFLHGLTANSRFFDAQAVELSKSFRVVRMDFRGHGATAADGLLTVERLGSDVAELLRHLDLTSVIGVGWSLGAMALWTVLLGDEADRFEGAVVIDMTARVPNDETWNLGLLNPERRAPRPDEAWEERCRRIAVAVLADEMQDERTELAETLVREMTACSPDAVAAFSQSLMEQDFRTSLSEIPVPTLIAYGARSQYYAPATSAFLASVLPGSRRVRFEHSGHSLHLEEPEKFNAMLVDFARSLPRAANRQISA